MGVNVNTNIKDKGLILEDVSIDHSDGTTVIKGVSVEKVKRFKNQVEGTSARRGEFEFSGVTGLDKLRPDGSVDHNILREKEKDPKKK